MLHFGIGELWCMILGFWYPVYYIEKYPAESFAWWHFAAVTALTCACIAVYFVLKETWIRRSK